jgi:uncharacterized OsmC-like protein
MVEISISYEGGLHCAATHGPSSSQIGTDAPVDNHGRGETFSPTDLVATALGTCMLTVIGIKAEQKGIDLTGATARVEKIMSDDSPRRISRLPIEIVLPIPADHENRKLLEAAALGCPVHHSVHPDIEKPVTFSYTG